MKASTQYNDFIGTAAADISDHTDLNKFLIKRGVDTKRYEAIGAKFFAWYTEGFSASIICIDKEESTDTKKHIVRLDFEAPFIMDEFFMLFKRFEVIITKKYGDFEDQDIDDEITIDDRIREE